MSSHDGRQELRVAEADHDQRPPVGGEEEGLRLVGASRRDFLQHYRVAQRNLTPDFCPYVNDVPNYSATRKDVTGSGGELSNS